PQRPLVRTHASILRCPPRTAGTDFRRGQKRNPPPRRRTLRAGRRSPQKPTARTRSRATGHDILLPSPPARPPINDQFPPGEPVLGLFDKLRGEFIDIIEWTQPSGSDVLCYRFPRYNNEIKYGAKLTVREGQAAAFVNEGQLADVYPPGMYTLETQNMPILS